MKSTHLNGMKKEDQSWQSTLSNTCDSKNLIENHSNHVKQPAELQQMTAHNVLWILGPL